jgi:hypothetical protein
MGICKNSWMHQSERDAIRNVEVCPNMMDNEKGRWRLRVGLASTGNRSKITETTAERTGWRGELVWEKITRL